MGRPDNRLRPDMKDSVDFMLVDGVFQRVVIFQGSMCQRSVEVVFAPKELALRIKTPNKCDYMGFAFKENS
jgi:hypothetical protein